MATFVNDSLRDLWLGGLTGATHLHITKGLVSVYANLASLSVGVKASPSIGSVGDATPTGRKRTVAAISDGTVTANSSPAAADHWALVDATKILVAGTIAAGGQIVFSGNVFTLTAFDVAVPDQA